MQPRLPIEDLPGEAQVVGNLIIGVQVDPAYAASLDRRS